MRDESKGTFSEKKEKKRRGGGGGGGVARRTEVSFIPPPLGNLTMDVADLTEEMEKKSQEFSGATHLDFTCIKTSYFFV
jgi:hypothetical protein